MILSMILAFWGWGLPSDDTVGIWQTEGHGLIVNISRFSVSVFEYTSISCRKIQVFPAYAQVLTRDDSTTFRRVEERLIISDDEFVDPIEATRLNEMPLQCSDPLNYSNTDPELNYEVFWQYFDQHYAFFDLHGVNWQKVYDSIRPTITYETTQAELFAAMRTSISGLDDGHTYVDRLTADFTGATLRRWEDYWDDFQPIPDQRADQDMRRIAGSGVRYGLIDAHIGFIVISHMDVEPPLGISDTEFAQNIAKELVNVMADTDAIIIDIRFNEGGGDNVSMAYAGAFTRNRVLAFTKMTRTKDGYTLPFDVYVNPAAGGHLDQPVYLLTSSLTISAAEIFTLAMRELPRVTVIGEASYGALSDVLSRELPNGWGIELSHQIYTAPNGQVYEGVGIPPDIFRPMDGEAFLRGHDSLLKEVIGMING